MPIAKHVSTWAPYVAATSAGHSQSEIARRADVDQATVHRWLTKNERPNALSVVRYARAYDLSPIEALVAAGVLTKAEAALREQRPELSDVPTRVLLRELSARPEVSA